MDVIREKPSKNGILDYQTFTNVNKTTCIDHYKTRWGTKPVILIHYNENDKFPIMFPNIGLRDRAYSKIESSTGVCVLDFNEFFTQKIVSDESVKKFVRYKLSEHLQVCIEKILKNEEVKLEDLVKRDAFKVFSITDLHSLLTKQDVTIKKSQLIPELWSKTLYTPNIITKQYGVTPMQFYKQMIENESINYRSTVDAV